MKTNDYVVSYMPFAENLAWKKSQTLPKRVSFEELKSAAYLGLVKASRKFDPNFGVSFPQYATKFISGAIVDYLRELKWDASVRFFEEDEEPPARLEQEIEILEGLEDLQKRVVIMYYQEGFTLKEIGSKIGVNESWVCQILSKTRQVLQRKIA